MADYDDKGLIAAFAFDGAGGARRIGWREIEAGEASPEGFIAVFLRDFEDRAQPWLATAAGLPSRIIAALSADNDRQHCELTAAGAFISLRGANLDAFDHTRHMPSVRVWVEARRVIVVRRQKLAAVSELIEAIDRGHGPKSEGEFVADLALRLVDRLDTTIHMLAEDADRLEDAFDADDTGSIGQQIADLRRVAIRLRRSVAPQREALNHFALEEAPWLHASARTRLREAAEHMTRLTDELDGLRERTAIIHDQMLERRAEQTNRLMLVLAVVTVVFAPLTLITGLLGMNTGGVPLTDTPRGFEYVIWAMLALSGGMIGYFRWRKWL